MKRLREVWRLCCWAVIVLAVLAVYLMEGDEDE